MYRRRWSNRLVTYTTLFRSAADTPAPGGQQPAGIGHRSRRSTDGRGCEASPGCGLRRYIACRQRAVAARVAGGRDRKSTRLNSSHRCNSYSVFCLKKKKKESIYFGGYFYEVQKSYTHCVTSRNPCAQC